MMKKKNAHKSTPLRRLQQLEKTGRIRKERISLKNLGGCGD